jgi:putative ABC transport system permease protein
LMATEVALAVVLLIGAGLLIRSFIKLLNVDPGYRSEQLLTARLSLPPRYQEKQQRVQFYEQLLARLSALPGVEVVGAISHLPLTSYNLGGWLRVEGRTVPPGQDEPPVPVGSVNPDFFRAMSIPLRSGRLLNDGDTAGLLSVVVISESLARRLFPDESPLGRRLFVPGSGAKLTTIVGVVGDIRHEGLDKEIRPAVYLSYRQSPSYQMALALRSAIDQLSLTGSVRSAVQAIDPSLPLYEVMTMERRLADSVATRRFNLILLGAFALLALVLASVGVYGVISYVVTQRTHEVGIRMALGAEAADVRRLFLKQGMRLVLVGVGAGLVGAFALTRVMTTLLFGIGAADPLTFAAAAILLILIALAACYLPARRATKVDPMVALRCE